MHRREVQFDEYFKSVSEGHERSGTILGTPFSIGAGRPHGKSPAADTPTNLSSLSVFFVRFSRPSFRFASVMIKGVTADEAAGAAAGKGAVRFSIHPGARCGPPPYGFPRGDPPRLHAGSSLFLLRSPRST